MWFCVGPSAAELWRYSDFQDGGRQPCWICCGVMVDHPRSVVDGCCCVLKFWLDRIYNFRDSAIFRLEFAYARPLLGRFSGHISPKWRHRSSYPQKAPSCAKARRLSHKAWKSVQRFDLCREIKDSQNSRKGVIFHLVGEKPHPTDLHKNLQGGCRPRHNHVCRVWNWNFEGLRFYMGSNFRFSYWFLHGLYNM